MGVYDTIEARVECPYCGSKTVKTGQTKEIGKAMMSYRPIDHTEDIIDRSEMPVYPSFPEDKTVKVWESQREKAEAEATLPEEFHSRDTVTATFECNSSECLFDSYRADILRQGTPSGAGRFFEAEIKVDSQGRLNGKPVNIEPREELDQEELDKFKEEYREKYQKLAEKYGENDFLIVSNWDLNED